MSDPIVKIAKDFYVPASNIKYYSAYANRPVMLYVREKRRNKEVFDLTGAKKTGSVIFLHSGEIMLSTLSVDAIHERMKKATGMADGISGAKTGREE